jgi:hypothetical protein
MLGFEPVTLTWKGVAYTVPAREQMLLIAKIEDALSGDTGQQAMTVLFRRQGPPHSNLAAAYGAALRHAGARVTDAEVYLSIQTDIAEKSRDEVMATIQGAIIGLLSIISPPVARSMGALPEAGPEPEKKL